MRNGLGTLLLDTVARYLEWLVPGQSSAIVDELAAFLDHRELMGWVLLGTMLLILWLLSRMTLLGWADLSYVLPVTAIGYVLTAILGKYFLGEEISYQGWAGTGLIVAGIILVGLTEANTTGSEQSR